MEDQKNSSRESGMTASSGNRSLVWWWVAGGVAVIIIVAVVWGVTRPTTNYQPSPSATTGTVALNQAVQSAPAVDVNSMMSGGLPGGWPADFPLIGKIAVTQSQAQQSPSYHNTAEALVVFSSSKNVAAVCDAYGNWGADHQWVVVTNGDLYGCHATSGLLLLKKNDPSGLRQMQLTMTPYQNGESVVSAYYTQK